MSALAGCACWKSSLADVGAGIALRSPEWSAPRSPGPWQARTAHFHIRHQFASLGDAAQRHADNENPDRASRKSNSWRFSGSSMMRSPSGSIPSPVGSDAPAATRVFGALFRLHHAYPFFADRKGREVACRLTYTSAPRKPACCSQSSGSADPAEALPFRARRFGSPRVVVRCRRQAIPRGWNFRPESIGQMAVATGKSADCDPAQRLPAWADDRPDASPDGML